MPEVFSGVEEPARMELERRIPRHFWSDRVPGGGRPPVEVRGPGFSIDDIGYDLGITVFHGKLRLNCQFALLRSLFCLGLRSRYRLGSGL